MNPKPSAWNLTFPSTKKQFLHLSSALTPQEEESTNFLPRIDGGADPCIDFIWFNVLACAWLLWNPGISKELRDDAVFVVWGTDGFHDGALEALYIPTQNTNTYI